MMNDETHAFERRLKQQPLREIPADWRREILAAAQPRAQSRLLFGSSLVQFFKKNRDRWSKSHGSPSSGLRPPSPPSGEKAGMRGRLAEIAFNLLFWPHPKAWAGLAAVWVFIIGFNLSQRDPAPHLAEKSSVPPMSTLLALRQQQQLLAELSGSPEATEADRPRVYAPKPHSEWLELRAL